MKQHNRPNLKAYISQSKMLPKLPSSSNNRLIPIGAAAFLGALGGMDAQIVYSGLQNVGCGLAINTNRCYANINGAGGNDVEIHRNHAFGNQFIQIDEVPGGGFEVNGFHAQVVGIYVYPYANGAGVNIGAGGPWGFQSGQANSLSEINNAYPNDKWTPLTNGTTRFIGIRGTISGNTKYGWMRLTKNGFGNHTIVDWAYESSGASILTGQTASLTADIALVKTVNDNTPDQNQVVTFTLVVSNSGPNAATNLEVTDVVPAGLTYVVGSQTGPGTYVNGAPASTGLKWQNLFIANGGSVVLTFQATVTGAPNAAITNFAQVTSSAELDADSTPNNGNIGEDDGDVETVTVNPIGSTSAVLSIDDNSICNGETANLKVLITGGTSPFTVVYSDGMTNFTVNNYVSNTNIPVSPGSNKNYSLVSVTDANSNPGTGNSGMPMLTINNGSSAAVLSVDDNSICNGQTANLKVAITAGTGPFTVVYSDGMTNFTENNYVNNANIPVTPGSNKTYSLVSVTDANGCLGTGNSGMPMVSVINGSTASVLSVDDNTICNGETANLKVAITAGTGPFTVIYSDGMTNFTVNNYVSNDNIPVSPGSNKTYSLVSVTDANGCLGTGNSGMPMVTVINGSTAAVLSVDDNIICNGETANLKVAITAGTGPYTVVYSDGMTNFTINNYVSNDNIPVMPTSDKTYSLVSVTDANGCLGTGNSGMPMVTVSNGSSAAVLSIDDNAICVSESANLKVLITGGIGPYTVVYSDGMTNFTVNNYNSNANIPVSPTSDKTYSLVSVTDNNNCLGTGNSGTPSITVAAGSTVGSGDFDDPNTWCGGTVPPNPIPEGMTVIINHNITIDNVLVNNGTIQCVGGAILTNNGTLKGKGTVECDVINNGTISPGN